MVDFCVLYCTEYGVVWDSMIWFGMMQKSAKIAMITTEETACFTNSLGQEIISKTSRWLSTWLANSPTEYIVVAYYTIQSSPTMISRDSYTYLGR